MVRGYSEPERKLRTMYKNGKRQRRTRGIVDKKMAIEMGEKSFREAKSMSDEKRKERIE